MTRTVAWTVTVMLGVTATAHAGPAEDVDRDAVFTSTMTVALVRADGAAALAAPFTSRGDP